MAGTSHNAAYVKLTDFAPGFSAYDADQQPTLRVLGGVAVMSGACTNASDVTPGAGGVRMLTVPAGCCPAQTVRAVCQGSGVYRYMLAVNPDGSVLAARYGDTANREAPAGSWFVLDATWAVA